MHSPILSALDSVSSPTTVIEREDGVTEMRDSDSPFPVMPPWQFDKDPFDTELDDIASSPLPPSPLQRFDLTLSNLTMLECKLEEQDDELSLSSIKAQIIGSAELLELVREDVRLTEERIKQNNERQGCRGYISLKLINQYPDEFIKPRTWDADIEDLTNRLEAEHHTETQYRTILTLEEQSLRGCVIPLFEKAHQHQVDMLKKVQDSVKDIKSESAALDEKIKIAMVLKFRRNTCIGLVSAVYQAMRRLERMEEEIQKGRKDLRQRKMQAQAVAAQTETDITAKYVACKAEIEREKRRLRDLISANKRLEEEIRIREALEQARENMPASPAAQPHRAEAAVSVESSTSEDSDASSCRTSFSRASLSSCAFGSSASTLQNIQNNGGFPRIWKGNMFNQSGLSSKDTSCSVSQNVSMNCENLYC